MSLEEMTNDDFKEYVEILKQSMPIDKDYKVYKFVDDVFTRIICFYSSKHDFRPIFSLKMSDDGCEFDGDCQKLDGNLATEIFFNLLKRRSVDQAI